MAGSLADENDTFEELESDDEDKDEEVDESERVRTRPVPGMVEEDITPVVELFSALMFLCFF